MVKELRRRTFLKGYLNKHKKKERKSTVESSSDGIKGFLFHVKEEIETTKKCHKMSIKKDIICLHSLLLPSNPLNVSP
jgi:hypothetical protein